MRKPVLTCLVPLALATAHPVAHAQQAAHRFDLDDFSRVARVSDPQFAPDGKSVIVVISRANLDEDRYDPELALIDVATAKSRTLVTGRVGLSSARFSPDGQRIAFLANVGATGPAMSTGGSSNHLQLFVMKASGGTPKQITTAPLGVQQFAWSPDAKTIAYVTADELPVVTGSERFNTSFEVLVNDDYLTDGPKTSSHIWLVSPDGGTARRLTSGTWSLPVSHPPGPPASAIAWTLDGTAVAFTRQASPHGNGGSDLELAKVSDGTLSPLKNQRGTFPIFAPVGGKIGFISGNGVSLVPDTGTRAIPVTQDLAEHGIERALWMPDGKTLAVAGNDSTHVSIWLQPIGGPAKRLDLGDLSPNSSYYVDMAVGKDGAIAFTGSSTSRPSELYYLASPDGPVKRLTDANAAVAAVQLGKVEMLEWASDTIGRGNGGPFYENGTLTYPPDFDASKKYPLVLVIHGGPTGASLLNWGSQAQLLAAKGWLVFQPNYRGSDNLGRTYQGAIRNDAGDGPGRDVLQGIEAVKRKGIVDTTRMAVSGWSYGGYMTTWMIGHYPIWKAAVAGAAVTDEVDQHTLGDDASGGRGGANSIWMSAQALDRQREQSPITYSAHMKTPTLVLSDVGDFRVPITQSYKLFHALKDAGVNTQFFAYPVSGHNPADPVLQRDVQRRWSGWLEQYLNSPAQAAPTGGGGGGR
ncbi:MAG TPA: S9 family peptidase [Gemmatimonadaceae bacterium]|nr:S9 family peptidase [Gemmatimonadaceae bacterium]